MEWQQEAAARPSVLNVIRAPGKAESAAPAYVLVEYAPELRAIEANWPKIKFHALREHAGLVFQRRMGD